MTEPTFAPGPHTRVGTINGNNATLIFGRRHPHQRLLLKAGVVTDTAITIKPHGETPRTDPCRASY